MYPNHSPFQQQPYPQSNINTNRIVFQQQNNPSTFTHNQQPIPSHNDNDKSVRTMYKSTIQTTTSSNTNNKGGRTGFGKLQTMGRFIPDIQQAPQPSKVTNQAPKVDNTSFKNVINFRSDRNEAPRMASSVIFNRETEQQLNRFPSFTPNQPTGGLSKLQALMNRNKISELPKEQQIIQTPEEKRKKQILNIKQQLELLNKKMENKGYRKTNIPEGNKPYFQLPTRKTAQSVISSTPNNSISTPQNINKQKDLSAQTQNNTHYIQQTNLVPSHGAQHQNILEQNSSQTVSNRPQLPANSVGEFKPTLAVSKTQKLASQSSFSSVSTSGSGWVNSNPYQQPKPQQGGMFKKKNAYISDQTSKVIQTQPKNTAVPPKLANVSNAVKDITFEIKPAQIVDQPKPKKGINISETYQIGQNSSKNYIIKQPKPTIKQFKKSDFVIGKKLGKGQYGQVMLVQHKQTGFLMGLKVMSKKQIRQERYQNQIARQLSINFYLTHRNIAPLYGYFSDEENVYLLVEYCTGGQLLSLLRKSNRMEDPQVSPIIRQICEGLDYIHKEGIIHRDIKPENILFNFNTVKICDFGWAVYSHNGMRRTVSGSPLYYSPQIVLQTEYDQKIDIWSIGMMTYECLLGKIPFRIYSQLDLNRIVEDQIKFPEYVDVTDDAKDFILKIMKKKPEERMQIKQMMRHPFITKYLKTGKISAQVIDEFRKVLS